MIEIIGFINDLLRTYYPIVSTIFGSLAAGRTVWVISKRRQDDKARDQAFLADIEKRLSHLDDKDTGRVNKMTRLCESQIETNKVAYGIAKRVDGRMDERSGIEVSGKSIKAAVSVALQEHGITISPNNEIDKEAG